MQPNKFSKSFKELKHRRFWATDGNRKANVVGFGALLPPTKELENPCFSIRNLTLRIKKSMIRAETENIRVPVAVRGSKTSVLNLPKRTTAPSCSMHSLSPQLALDSIPAMSTFVFAKIYSFKQRRGKYYLRDPSHIADIFS